jgi:alpha,alpha-trehalase
MDEFSRAQTSKSDEGAEGRSAARARIAREMEFLETAMDAVWHELSEFWDVERSVSVISSASSESAHILSRYGPHDPQGEWRTPRPESFPQDVSATESLFATTSEREEAYAHIRAAAESGWDFSSRWIRSPARGIADSKTRDILPVDLNSFLYIAWIAVHDTYHHLLRLEVEHDRTVDAEKPGKAEDERSKSKRRKSLEWKDRARDARRLARRRMQGMVDILYDQSTGLFTDMDLVGIAGADAYRAKRATCDAPSLPSPFPVCDADESRPRRPLDLPVHAGMLVPLLLSSCETDIHPYATGSPARARGMRALAPLLFDSPGGVPVSLVETEGQTQWDWPNAWAPTSFFALLSLASPSSSPSDTSDLDSDFASTSSCATPFLRPFDLAAPNPAEIRLARKVIMPMFCLWTKTHGMYEKYRADKRWSETPGGGGEYGVQTGFGWTNGIAMWAMERYGLLLDLGGCGEQVRVCLLFCSRGFYFFQF